MRFRIPQGLRRTGARIGRFFAHDAPGLILLLVGTFALLLPRMRKQETLWMDEVFSVLMANRTFADIIGLTALDVHPPLFYFTLKFWMKGFRTVGIEPGLVETRLFGVLVLLIFLAICWLVLRRFLGKSTGSLATIVVAASPIAGGYAAEIRQYAFLLPMVCACWLLMCRIAWRERIGEVPASKRERLFLWGSYGVLASAMLWMQLIAGIVLFWLGIFWLVLLFLRGRRRAALLRYGTVTQAAIVASIVPWYPSFRLNLSYLEEAPTWWMTEANLLNAWGTPFFWGIYGRLGILEASLHWYVLLLGVGGLLIPLAFLPSAVFAAKKRLSPSPLLLVGISGVAISAAVMLTMFYAAYFEIAKLFHAPRYPMIVMPVLLMGIVALSAWSLKRMGLSPHWSWLLFLLLFYNFGRGHDFFLRYYVEGPSKEIMMLDPELFPPADVPVYIQPDTLYTIYRNAIPHENVRPISEIANHPREFPMLLIFMLNPWMNMEQPHDLAFRASINREFISKQYAVDWLTGGGEIAVMTFPIEDHLARFESMPWHRATRPDTDSITSLAAPEMQRPGDGWGRPEIDHHGSVMIPAFRREVTVAFDNTVKAGPHRLIFGGYNPPWPADPAEFLLDVEGAAAPITLTIPSGFFHEEIDITITRNLESPTMRVAREMFVPDDIDENPSSKRPTSFTFYGAAMEALDE